MYICLTPLGDLFLCLNSLCNHLICKKCKDGSSATTFANYIVEQNDYHCCSYVCPSCICWQCGCHFFLVVIMVFMWLLFCNAVWSRYGRNGCILSQGNRGSKRYHFGNGCRGQNPPEAIIAVGRGDKKSFKIKQYKNYFFACNESTGDRNSSSIDKVLPSCCRSKGAFFTPPYQVDAILHITTTQNEGKKHQKDTQE